MKDVDLGKPRSFLDHVYLGCTQRGCQMSNDIVANFRNVFEPRISAVQWRNYHKEGHGETWCRNDLLGPMTWKVTQRNVWKDIANLQIKRLSNFPNSQRHPWMTINLKKQKISQGRIVYSMFTNCSQMSVFGSYWETWYFIVCEQTCSCGHQMDKILWQTLGAFDLVHSSYKWTPTILLSGKHSTTMQTWVVSRLWFCRISRRLNINIKRSSVHFWESHVCANKLDVQETNISFTQFNRIWNHFSRCRFSHGRHSRSHSLGFGDWSVSFRAEQNRWTQERAMEKPVGSCQAKHA